MSTSSALVHRTQALSSGLNNITGGATRSHLSPTSVNLNPTAYMAGDSRHDGSSAASSVFKFPMYQGGNDNNSDAPEEDSSQNDTAATDPLDEKSSRAYTKFSSVWRHPGPRKTAAHQRIKRPGFNPELNEKRAASQST